MSRPWRTGVTDLAHRCATSHISHISRERLAASAETISVDVAVRGRGMTTADRIAELERRAEALRAELRQAEAAAMLCRARVEGIEVEIEWLRQEEADA